jgi:hypothetical protein
MRAGPIEIFHNGTNARDSCVYVSLAVLDNSHYAYRVGPTAAGGRHPAYRLSAAAVRLGLTDSEPSGCYRDGCQCLVLIYSTVKVAATVTAAY